MCLVLLFAVLLSGINQGCGLTVKLEKLSSIRLPHAYTPLEYALDSDDAKAIAYDSERRILYCVGWYNIHVIDISDVTKMNIVHNLSEEKMLLTDIEFCGGYVFVTIDDLRNRTNGVLRIYSRYDETRNEMQLQHTIRVGKHPTMVLPNSDCRTVVVTVEVGLDAAPDSFEDEDDSGGLVIIKFTETIENGYDLVRLDLDSYMERRMSIEFYAKRDTKPAYAFKPEYIAFSNDETQVYVSLQENNAIAIVDLKYEHIIEVHNLGFKNWSRYRMDASDMDDGINLQSWPVYGMYQPKTIKLMTLHGTDYIVTANEGSEKPGEASNISELLALTKKPNDSASDKNLQELLLDEHLGRLKVSKFERSNSTIDAMHAFGGRSFSIWRADDMSLVYDSGDSIAVNTSVLYPELFNCGPKAGEWPQGCMDKQSPDKGPEPESLAVAKFGPFTLIIVGNKKPGTLSVYSIDETNVGIQPKFEGLFHDIQRLDNQWEALVTYGEATMLGPEDLRFIASQDSPIREPLVDASGTFSGTVTMFQVQFETKAQIAKATPAVSTYQTNFVVAFLNENQSKTRLMSYRRNGTKPTDILFILDASSSVGSSNFNTTLQFVERLVDEFSIGVAETQIGMITFDNEVYLQFNFKQFHSKTAIRYAILHANYTRGGTDIAEALRYAREIVFQAQSGMRKNAAKIAIIITDGRSNMMTVQLESEKLRAAGVSIFAIGVGASVDIALLNVMATDPDNSHRFSVKNFNSLDMIRRTLLKNTCEVKAKLLPTTTQVTRERDQTVSTLNTDELVYILIICALIILIILILSTIVAYHIISKGYCDASRWCTRASSIEPK